MTHSKSYPISNQVNNISESHLTPAVRKTNYCTNWVPFVLTGVGAITFLLCIHYLGGSKIFPMPINIYADLVPIIHQGSLQVFPFTIHSNRTSEDSFIIKLPLSKSEESEYVKTLNKLLESYPAKHESPYKNCWLENPTADHPCFYDRTWLSEICSTENSFGYKETLEKFNPCFILKFKDPGDWKPSVSLYRVLIDPKYGYLSEEIDHGFVPVVCEVRGNGTRLPLIKVYPPKGFSLLYFPMSSFDENKYLPPLVAVKVQGIRRDSNITIHCSIVTPNSFVLWNNGKVSLTFQST